MNGLLKCLALVLAFSGAAFATDQPIESVRASKDIALNTNPRSQFWQGARPVFLQLDVHGNPVPKYRTEVRTRWTDKYLYFLFICPYQELNLKPDPNTSVETNQLWNWDVAEVFLGSDFQNIKRYKEFELSPQGEWIDLDIDLNKPHHEDGWVWNSGFKVSARIDKKAHVWYGAMKIPYSAVDTKPAAAGNVLRANLFRSEGPESRHHEVTWHAPMSNTFHVPERFGLYKLVEK
ncbi:MAG TPA: carbohydrate-binding family 9-like protein [Terriglobales bacterium]|nr:carbohydrate-binding family 9-like protein [Terriglobales bacterium]